ncbi:hypothetical protein GQ55_7G232000 [Panicum hallii var. hallii]|uniref:Uncharacterized protein n=1 Tax=Panicum hallii var. hallii TaxID=1504633 RepID=A0A2T7CY35_9POAL|nr:hypothetical protein GQ55_7G232000 [Panicum hallii var. hallii]
MYGHPELKETSKQRPRLDRHSPGHVVVGWSPRSSQQTVLPLSCVPPLALTSGRVRDCGRHGRTEGSRAGAWADGAARMGRRFRVQAGLRPRRLVELRLGVGLGARGWLGLRPRLRAGPPRRCRRRRVRRVWLRQRRRWRRKRAWGSGSASAAPAARAATLAASAGEPAAGRLGLEVITRLTAAGARAVGSAVAEGSGHREDAVVAATEEGQSASGGGAVRCATANKHAFLASSCVTL